MSPRVVLVLSAIAAGFAIANAALYASLPGYSSDEIASAAHLGLAAFFAYLGVGAVVPQIHPGVGNKLDTSSRRSSS